MPDDPKTTAKHRNQIAAEVIADASAFAAWWTKRHHPVAVDEAIVIQAQAAGLLYRGSGMLRLSPSGLKLTSTTGVQQVMAETPTTDPSEGEGRTDRDATLLSAHLPGSAPRIGSPAIIGVADAGCRRKTGTNTTAALGRMRRRRRLRLWQKHRGARQTV